MIPFSVAGGFSWIGCTHVGEPRADGNEGLVHCISTDRLAGLAGLSVAETEDEEVTEALVGVVDVMEGTGDPKFSAEGQPLSKDLVVGGTSLCTSAGLGNSQRRAEISSECRVGSRCRRVQG